MQATEEALESPTAAASPGYSDCCTECGRSTKNPNSHSASKSLSLTHAEHPFLRRCFSDPVSSPGTSSSQQAVPVPVHLPGNSKIHTAATTMPSLPPLPPILRRSVSDPTSPPSQMTAGKCDKCGGSLSGRNFEGPLSVGEVKFHKPLDSTKEQNPKSKKLKRMKDRLRELSQWWAEVMREGELEDDDDICCREDNTNPKMDEAEAETEELVSVERVGEGLSIHFKCPCGKGYQILLSGSNCYYKLM